MCCVSTRAHVTASTGPNWSFGCAAETRATGEETAECDGAMGVNEGCGQVLLAGINVERKCEESRTRGQTRIAGRGVGEEACQRGQGEFGKAATKCKVLVA